MTQHDSQNECAQNVLDAYASKAEPQYETHAEKFRSLTRWTEDDPVLLVMDAVGSASGLNYADIVKPNVEQFCDEFIETGRVASFTDMVTLEDNADFEEEFTIGRPELAYKIPQALLDQTQQETDDLTILQEWAESATPESYRCDPVGDIKGIGLATFQYLRMIAGANTAKPDIQVKRFIETLEREHPELEVNAGGPLERLHSVQWLADQTSYSMVEIDQIAWWVGSETTSLSSAH